MTEFEYNNSRHVFNGVIHRIFQYCFDDTGLQPNNEIGARIYEWKKKLTKQLDEEFGPEFDKIDSKLQKMKGDL